MRNKILSFVLALSLIVSSTPVAAIAVEKDNTQKTAKVEGTALEEIAEPTLTKAQSEDIIDESDIDQSAFLPEDDIEYKTTDFFKASVDTMTREGGNSKDVFWSDKHEEGWTIGRGRYVWLRFDNIADYLTDSKYEDMNLVQANVNVAHRAGKTAGDTYTVRYIKSNDWNNQTLSHDTALTMFNDGTDIGSGKGTGSATAAKINTYPADGLSRCLSREAQSLSLCLYGDSGGTGADVISLDTTAANNKELEVADTERPSLELIFSNATVDQVEFQNDKEPVVAKLEEIIGEYDNLALTSAINLPISSNGITVSYSLEESDWAALDDTTLSVTRPEKETGDQTVSLKVTCQKNKAKFSYYLNIIVLALQDASPLNDETLSNVIEFAQTQLDEQIEKRNIADPETATAGQFDQEKANILQTNINTAKACTNNAEKGDYASLLVSNLYDLFSSGKIDNTIVYKSKNKYLDFGNTLEYSSYRAKLEGLVVKAKATLLLDPSLYPQSAKDALQVEIERAELALARNDDGTSKLELPFTKTRMFHASYDDAMIRYATSYSSFVTNFSMSQYGLEPVIDWYMTQNILYDAFTTVEIEPTYQGYIRSNEPGNFVQSGSMVVGKTPNDRIGILQFDLSNIEGSIKSAKVKLVATNTNTNLASIYNEKDYDVSEVSWNRLQQDNGSFVEAGNGIVSGKAIGTIKPGGKETKAYGNVTDGAIAQKSADKVLTLSIQQQAETTYADDFYTVYNTTTKAYQPSLVVKTSDISMQSLNNQVDKLIAQQEDLIVNASTYTDIRKATVGAYDKSAHTRAKQALATVKSLQSGDDLYALGEAAIEFLNAAFEMRKSIAFLSDIDVDENGEARGNIFYSAEDIADLKERVKTNETLKDTYQNMKENMKSISYDVSLDYWNRWNENDLSMWKENKSFTTPPASTGDKYVTGRGLKSEDGKNLFDSLSDDQLANYSGKAYVTLTLDSGDNDTTGYMDAEGKLGCGEVWIDNLTLTPSTLTGIELPNPSFETASPSEKEMPAQWTCITTGKGEGKWESRSVNVSNGNRSIYLHNPDGESSVMWKSNTFSLPKDGYEIYYQAKQIGVFEETGVKIRVHLVMNDGSEVISRANYYNAKTKPSVTGVGSYTVTMQRAAILAMLADTQSEMEYYAKLAKVYFYLYLDEINQGIESWLTANGRPDGIDAYGAVQAGRGGGSLATAYSIVKNMKYADGTPIFSDEEKQELTEMVGYLIRDLNDIRDRYTMTRAEVAYGASNWQSDMSMGACMLAMAFDDTLPNSRAFFYSGLRQDEAMLIENMREDGSWPESVRYHNAAVSKLAVLAKAVRASSGIDWFADPQINFYKAFDYLCNIQTPTYANANASTPFFGDHILSTGSELYMCGLYSDEVVDTMPDLAKKMKGTWQNAGSQAPSLSGDDNQLQAFFGHEKDDLIGDTKEVMATIKTTDAAKYFGTYIFRNNFMVKGKESYLATMIQEKETSHSHYDQLSFIMYADNVPLVIDPGSSPTYWGGNASLYTGSHNHSTVTYAKDASRSAYYNKTKTSTLKQFYASDSLDKTKGSTAANNGTSGEHTRDIAFIKNGFEAYVIWDQISGSTNGTSFTLPLLTEKDNAISMNGNKVTAEMFSNIKLDMTVLHGNTAAMSYSTYDANGSFAKRLNEDKPRYDLFEIQNEGNDDYLVVLFPQTKARGTLTTTDLGDDVYKLTHSSGNSVYVAVNGKSKPKTISIAEAGLTDMETLNDADPTVYSAGDSITIPRYSMKLLTPKVTTTQKEEEDSPKTPEKPSGSQMGATGGGAASGGATEGDTTKYVSGDNSKTDFSLPGITNAPFATVSTEQSDKFVLVPTLGNQAYYSLNGAEYVKYTGPVTLPEGENTIVYFTANSISGLKTRGVELTITNGTSNGNIVTPSVKKKVSVTLGKTKKLKVKNAKGATITYKSKNKKVVKVTKKGKLKPVKKGKAKIKMKVVLGGKTYSLKTTVTVKK
ncbi:MAG: heparinase II/III family protein [Lachnospiraceae bacterium]